ncbi:MAG TPA: hypothetical protein VGO53_16270 [Steroidobacteraceae bacterium]|jgi:hypothetical protein|nr:hypothetical protein [Steroidobacteraceae bacterium]
MRYTAEHLAAAHKLDLHLGSKATERIAQALADHEMRGEVRGRGSMSADIEDALRQTMAFALGDKAIVQLVEWLQTNRTPRGKSA